MQRLFVSICLSMTNIILFYNTNHERTCCFIIGYTLDKSITYNSDHDGVVGQLVLGKVCGNRSKNLFISMSYPFLPFYQLKPAYRNKTHCYRDY